MQAIIIVIVLPPNECLSNLVNFEFLYGTNAPFFFGSLNIFMQFPSAKRLVFILDPSLYLLLFIVTAAFSLPAKSIIVNFEIVFIPREFYSTVILRIACDRLETLFANVEAIVLL